MHRTSRQHQATLTQTRKQRWWNNTQENARKGSDEESVDMQGPAPDEELFICSGPWSAPLHSPTRSSSLEFEILYGSDPEHASALTPACGADLGDFPVIIRTHDPVSACRRKACIIARAALQG